MTDQTPRNTSQVARCSETYAYDDRTCALPHGHDDEDHHCSADRFHWLHHAEEVDAASATWDVWDEPIDRLNQPGDR